MLLKNYLADFIHLIYPLNCICCEGHLVKNENVLCSRCLFDLPRTNFNDEDNNIVSKLFWGKLKVENATSLFYFNKGSRYQVILHKLKYRGMVEIGKELGRLTGTRLLNLKGGEVDLIIPVPLHRNRLKQRGYNQSTFIAEGIAEIIKKPVIEDVMIRKIFTLSQTGKGVYERWENVDQIFEVKKPEKIKNKHVLLVDDVITTGSTLEACAMKILEQQGTKVSIATLAVTQKI